MPDYRFGLDATRDDARETATFADAGAARRHAMAKALEALWESPYRLHAQPEWGVRVEDAAGGLLFTVPLSEALAFDFGAGGDEAGERAVIE